MTELQGKNMLITGAPAASAVLGIRLMTAGIPALALLLAYWFLRGYSLRGQKLAAVQEDCMSLHEMKRAAVEELGSQTFSLDNTSH